jgi:hypothetical protein
MVKNPFTHKSHETGKRAGSHHQHFGEWLKREDEGVSGRTSSLFWSHHEKPLAPQRTCIQGHEIAPGETVCSHGHPIG